MPIREILYDPTEETKLPEEDLDVKSVESRTHAPVNEGVFQTKQEARAEAEKFLTLGQASKACGMSRGLFKNMAELSKFPSLEVGKKIRLFKKSDLDRWLQTVKSIFA